MFISVSLVDKSIDLISLPYTYFVGMLIFQIQGRNSF